MEIQNLLYYSKYKIPSYDSIKKVNIFYFSLAFYQKIVYSVHKLIIFTFFEHIIMKGVIIDPQFWFNITKNYDEHH